jgi:hypothetical protein
VEATQVAAPRLAAAKQGLPLHSVDPQRLVVLVAELRLGKLLVWEADQPGSESLVLSEVHRLLVLKTLQMHRLLAKLPHRTPELRPSTKRLLLLVVRLSDKLPPRGVVLRSGNHQRLDQAQLLENHRHSVLRHPVLQLSAVARHLEPDHPQPAQHLASLRSPGNKPLPSDNRHNLLSNSLLLANQHRLEVLAAPHRRLANQPLETQQHSAPRQVHQHSARHQRPPNNHPSSVLQQPMAQQEPSAAKHHQTTHPSAAQRPQPPVNASQLLKANG